VNPGQLVQRCVAPGQADQMIAQRKGFQHCVDGAQPLGGLGVPWPVGVKQKQGIADQPDAVHVVRA